MAKIVILGAGVMGSAMSLPASAKGHSVDLVGTFLDTDSVRSVQGNGLHPRLGITLPETVAAYEWTDFASRVDDETALIILGVSSAGVTWAIEQLAGALTRPIPVLMITKGLSPENGKIEVFPSIVARELEARLSFHVPVLAVGGPCIAGELAAGRDTGVVITGHDAALVKDIIALVDAPFYHARASGDVVGVEVCAAFKNFFALGVGWATGHLEKTGRATNGAQMHNLSASLFAQSLREMSLLSAAFGGTQASVDGLPGVGDLYVTCLAGRNSRMGRLLGLGLSYPEAKAGHMAEDTVEGAELALAVGPTLEAMWADGRLPVAKMPMSQAIIDAVCHAKPMTIDWREFHR